MSVTPSAPDALAAAVRSKDAAAVARVLERFPELRARLDDAMPGDAFGATPLLAAVYDDNREMVELLLGAGANINQRSHWWAGGFGVLDHEGPLVDFLIERGADVDVFAAARLGRLDRLDELLATDPALVQARGGDGQTPLHLAQAVPVAEYLLDKGAEIDARDVDHESTPAQWMIRDRQQVARYLVSRGCRTDLLLASALGDLPLVTRHLDADTAAIRMTVSDEHFPKQDPRSAGTIYNWTLGRNKGPHVIAHEFGHDDMLRVLMDRSPAELQLAAWCEIGDAARVREMLARDPAVAGRLPPADHRKLPDAARDEKLEAVRLLLAAGWPIDARGQHGATALHWAAWNGNVDIAREVLRHKPPLELKDLEYDGTPLHWGIYGSRHGWRCSTGDYAAVVEALLRAGATPPPITGDLEASDAVRQVLVRWLAL